MTKYVITCEFEGRDPYDVIIDVYAPDDFTIADAWQVATDLGYTPIKVTFKKGK